MDNSWIGIVMLIVIGLLVSIPITNSAKKNEAASHADLDAQHIEHAPVDNEPSSGAVWFWTIVGLVAGVLFVVYGLPHM